MKKSLSFSSLILTSLIFSPTALGAVVHTDWITGGTNTPPSAMVSELTTPKKPFDIHQTDEFNAVIKTLKGVSNDNGNIGIGTLAPATKLHIAGEVTVNNLKDCNNDKTVKADATGKLICATDNTGGGGGGGGTDGVLAGASLVGNILELTLSTGSIVKADLSALSGGEGGNEITNVSYNNTTNKLIFLKKDGTKIELDITQIFTDQDKYVKSGEKSGNNLILTFSDGSKVTIANILGGGGSNWILANGNVYRETGKVGIGRTSTTPLTSMLDITPTANTPLLQIGKDATAGQDQSVAIGNHAKANGGGAMAIGDYAEATNTSAVSFGMAAKATGAGSNAIGKNAQAKGADSLALKNSIAEGNHSIAAGHLSTAKGEYSTALGYQNITDGMYSMAIGDGVVARGDRTHGIGFRVATDNGVTHAMTVGIGTPDKLLSNWKSNSLLLGALQDTKSSYLLLDGTTGNAALNGNINPNIDFVIGSEVREGDLVLRGYAPEVAIVNLVNGSDKTAGIQLTANSKDWNIALDGNDANKLKFDYNQAVGMNTVMDLASNGNLTLKGKVSAFLIQSFGDIVVTDGSFKGAHSSTDGTQGIQFKTVNLKGANGNNCTMTIKDGLVVGTNCQ